MKTLACGLDCYDACEIVYKDGKISGNLCSVVHNQLPKTPRITKPTIDGVEVSLKEALDEISLDRNSLLYRGSGNVGVMNDITNLLFEQLNATTTKGSLCDGAGEYGIEEGRGFNSVVTPRSIKEAEVVVVWGRNISTTNSHLMPYLEGKTLIVIDPIQTRIAQKADIHLQIRPRTDFYLALLLARFSTMQDLQKDTDVADIEDFYEFTREFRIKPILAHIGVEINDISKVIEYLSNPKVVYLVGLGVQKYSIGDSVLRAIDGLAITLGHFNRDGCGVSFLGNSKLGLNNIFAIKGKKVSKVDTEFENFDTVLIQGANPAHSMPNSNRVIQSLKKVKNLVYFGLYENETSRLARVVIPALNFLEKDDVRLSYSDYSIKKMNKINSCDYGISEYDFTKYMIDKLKLEPIKSEQEYIELWLNQERDEIADIEEFEFIDDFYDDFENIKRFRNIRRKGEVSDGKYFLITPKASNSINSQFKRDNHILIHSNSGFRDGDNIKIRSEYGVLESIVKIDDTLREDCIVVKVNHNGVNQITPSIISQEGESACFQEVRVEVNYY
ncbi:Anaerobic dehydrogenases, typically selenocysteine-containing [hydrothermal vent metagenome]|uniref:Anaerobic dehydrogenases, typically selenocysteine-containing n=1 Tax=hydrothermal vent metagenome TaxID=652676 RepID=A0A1W1EI97_9ZZZZ